MNQDAIDKVVYTILYSNKKPGKSRLYKVHWVKEYPDEWLPYYKVPKGLRVAFERTNTTRRKGKKEQNTLSVKTSAEANAVAQQNEVEVFIFIKHEFNCSTNIGYLLLFCVF